MNKIQNYESITIFMNFAVFLLTAAKRAGDTNSLTEFGITPRTLPLTPTSNAVWYPLHLLTKANINWRKFSLRRASVRLFFCLRDSNARLPARMSKKPEDMFASEADAHAGKAVCRSGQKYGNSGKNNRPGKRTSQTVTRAHGAVTN